MQTTLGCTHEVGTAVSSTAALRQVPPSPCLRTTGGEGGFNPIGHFTTSPPPVETQDGGLGWAGAGLHKGRDGGLCVRPCVALVPHPALSISKAKRTRTAPLDPTVAQGSGRRRHCAGVCGQAHTGCGWIWVYEIELPNIAHMHTQGGSRMAGNHSRRWGGGGCPRDALEGEGPQRWFQKRSDRHLEEPKRLGAVTVGYKCR